MCVMVFSCDGLRCWGEAKAHADALWAQGVHVEVEPNMLTVFGHELDSLHRLDQVLTADDRAIRL